MLDKLGGDVGRHCKNDISPRDNGLNLVVRSNRCSKGTVKSTSSSAQVKPSKLAASVVSMKYAEEAESLAF